ncbi:MAG: hypothetical protein QXG25_01980 [Nitrososphaerota archaeon]
MMTSRVYVDTADSSGKKSRKKHVCYDPQARMFFKLNRLTELHCYDEVYVDSLFQRLHEEVLELLRRGVKVFRLKEVRLIKRLRESNGIEKSDESDAYILSLIPDEFYRELSAEELQLKRLVSEYLAVDRLIVKLKSCGDRLKLDLRESIKALEMRKEEIAERICDAVEGNEFYRRVLEYLGYRRSPLIAMLLAMIDFSRGTHKILDYLGLHAKAEEHNHTARTILSKIAANIYMWALNPRMRDSVPEKYIRIAQRHPRGKAMLKIQTEVIRDIRRLWLNQQVLAAR